jgi:hypothetical protein
MPLAHALLVAAGMMRTVPRNERSPRDSETGSNRMTRWAPALLLLLASACTVAGDEKEDDILDEGEITLANPDDQGKSDTVFGKQLRYAIRGEWYFDPQDDSMTTDTEVLLQTSTLVRVKALRTAIGLPEDELLDVSVDAESFNDLGEISTDMAFILFASEGSKAWIPTRCAQNYFERVVVDRASREIDVVARGAEGDTARTFTFAECGIPDRSTQVAIFPFPSSNWWSLEGYYHLKIEADCGSRLCPAATPVLYF